MDLFSFTPGPSPLLVSMPHVGTALPDDIRRRLTPDAARLADTDWHVDLLYGDFLADLGASVLAARYSRYVVDLNRPSTDESLYPGQTTTGLFPLETFTGAPVYQPGLEPDAPEKQARVERYWQPYHDRLATALAEIRERHGHALLWEAHSIAPVLPRLFDGRLPDINLGSNAGAACPAGMAQAVLARAQADGRFTAVLDGRFRGGFITRHYGRPADRVYALQLELSQATYLDDGFPPTLDPDRAATIRPVLQACLEEFIATLHHR